MQIRHFLSAFFADVKRELVPHDPPLFCKLLGFENQHSREVLCGSIYVGNRCDEHLWDE